MKNKILLIAILTIIVKISNAQITTLINTNPVLPPIPPFVGWDIFGPPNTLDIKTEQNDNIHIHTFTGGLGFGNIRQTILGSYVPLTDGLIGLGDMGTTGVGSFIPQSLLHQHRNLKTFNYHQFTNLKTGILTNDGFKLGINWVPDPLSPGNSYTIAELRQQENAPMIMYQGDDNAGPSTLFERMKISSGIGEDLNRQPLQNVTKVFINHGGTAIPTYVTPVSMLNIGDELPVPTGGNTFGGWRPWMDVGTYYNFDSDNLYTGLKNEARDRDDAVIDWGDNLLPAPDQGPQNLRFIFTRVGNAANLYTNNPWGTTNGLEIARMNSNGNFGVGDFYRNGYAVGYITEPVRRVEILDEKVFTNNYPNVSANNPQLRLTFSQATAGNTLNTGIWTDMQTTSLGDLYIHPNSGATFHNVGINTSTPQKTLEINSNDGSASPGNSGLRLTDLTSASTPAALGTYPYFLTVNATGDVVLGEPGPFVTSCASAATDVNYITKWKTIAGSPGIREICRTQGIYEETLTGNFNVGIGVGTAPQAKLHVGGDILLDYSFAILTKDGTGAPHPILRMFPGYGTISVGADAGNSSTGLWNVYAGYSAGSGASDADYCTFVGSQSGLAYVGTTGNENNTFIGADAALQQHDGTDNTYVGGRSVAPDMLTGSNNTFVGTQAGRYAELGDDNVYIGREAGRGSRPWLLHHYY